MSVQITPPPTRVALYERSGSADPLSPEEAEKLRAWVRSWKQPHGDIVKEYLSDGDGAGWIRLTAGAEAKEADMVVVFRPEHVAAHRDLVDRLAELRLAKVRLVIYPDNDVLGTLKEADLGRPIKMLRWYETYRSETIRAAMKEAQRRGVHVGRPPKAQTTQG